MKVIQIIHLTDTYYHIFFSFGVEFFVKAQLVNCNCKFLDYTELGFKTQKES